MTACFIRAVIPATFIVAAVLTAAPPAYAQAPTNNPPCKFADSKIVNVALSAKRPNSEVQLNDEIVFEVAKLPLATNGEDCARKLVLFVNGRAIPDARSVFDKSSPTTNRNLVFILQRTELSDSLWRTLLRKPTFNGIPIIVALGPVGGPQLSTANEEAQKLSLQALPTGWFLIWFLLFLVIALGFLRCVRRSSILRDGVPDRAVTEPSAAGTYSLAKTQAAWWFFVILASYLLVGIVTGDFNTSINETAVILLAIGGGTVLGAAVVNTSKDTAQNKQQEQVAKTRVQAQIASLNTPANALPPAEREMLMASAQSEQRKLTGVSEHFLVDILSDATGVNFHRFQMVAWTVVLSVIFAWEVYETLAMPKFSSTLLGLQGLSAGTYLGLKTQEPVVAKT